MSVERRASTVVRASGYVDFDDLTDYVKQRVVVQHAELLQEKLVFPRAVIRGNSGRIFELTVFKQNGKSVIDIYDQTKGPPVKGLTVEERWERAGLKPNGELIDRNKLE